MYKETFTDRNNFLKAAPTTTFMHLKEEHMKNTLLEPEYNSQLEVEDGYGDTADYAVN